ncbi:PREDICTED: uncharacterized protein LOC105152108 [Acromyrmex echinatior]|uniref:uncharacterized protein LOC105152108 n=1 Tax=Acromyrmex echinatior TaxID=103372 RepID=UPI000580D7DA|nr:PREDICTED: uncharacterized protein LOC105152108 [Acromyrmex echinatior]
MTLIHGATLKDYKKKNLLSNKAYKKLDKDPTNTIAQNTKILVEKSNIPSEINIKRSYKSCPTKYTTKTKSTQIKHSPQTDCQRHTLPDIQLIPLPSTNTTTPEKYESHITDSTDFIQKIQQIQLRPTDLLVSFDVESLFTQVPIKDTLNIIKALYDVTSSSDFIPLIKHCLTTTYFSYNNQFYEQTSGAAMGSPISVIANIFMEHFEKEALRKTFKKFEVWFRYVDDTFVIWRHGRAELRKFLTFLNN